jgi:chromosome segregation ATPase
LTYKAEMMEMLRNNYAVNDIRGKFRSKSMLYECLTDYLVELTDKVDETRTVSRQEETKLLETKTRYEELTSERNRLQKAVNVLSAGKDSLEKAVGSLRKEHDGLVHDVADLEGRGFSPEIVVKLKTAIKKDGAEVVALLEAHEKADELRREVAFLEQRKSDLTSEISILEGRTRKTAEKVAWLQDKHDSLKQQVAAFQAASAKAEAEVQARVETVQNAVLSTIENTRKEGKEAIDSVRAQASAEVNKLASDSANAIRSVSGAVNDGLSHCVDELSKLQKEKGRLEYLLEPARVLNGAIQSPAVLKTLPPTLVITLLRNLALWFDQEFPNADTGAVYNVAENEFHFYEFAVPRFRLSPLVKLAAEALTKQASQRLKEESK